MGKPAWGEPQAPLAEHIGQRGERGELKHLSTRRKREYSLSSGERKGNSPNRCHLVACGPMWHRGCRARLGYRTSPRELQIRPLAESFRKGEP